MSHKGKNTKKQAKSAGYIELNILTFESQVEISDFSLSNKEFDINNDITPISSSSPKLRHSNFYLTINTNQSFPDHEDPKLLKMSNQLAKALKTYLGPDSLPDFVQFRDPTHF